MKQVTINVEDLSEEYGEPVWNVNAYDQDGDTVFSEDFDNSCEAEHFGLEMYEAHKGKANTLLIIEGNGHTLKMGDK